MQVPEIPVSISKERSFFSWPPVRSLEQSGANATAFTMWLWGKETFTSPVTASHKFL